MDRYSDYVVSAESAEKRSIAGSLSGSVPADIINSQPPGAVEQFGYEARKLRDQIRLLTQEVEEINARLFGAASKGTEMEDHPDTDGVISDSFRQLAGARKDLDRLEEALKPLRTL